MCELSLFNKLRLSRYTLDRNVILIVTWDNSNFMSKYVEPNVQNQVSLNPKGNFAQLRYSTILEKTAETQKGIPSQVPTCTEAFLTLNPQASIKTLSRIFFMPSINSKKARWVCSISCC